MMMTGRVGREARTSLKISRPPCPAAPGRTRSRRIEVGVGGAGGVEAVGEVGGFEGVVTGEAEGIGDAVADG